jgi:DNA-binding PucR family transcriptional regulator
MAALCALPPDGVLIGLGEPGQGRSGFRRSHAQAREAERTTRLSGVPVAGVVRHHDVELAALLCADPDHAGRFATDRLGPLSARDEGTGRLRETLRTYLASGCSTARTAEVLHVHQKTVAYRLARCTELLGRPLGQANGELEAALLIDLTLHGV